MNRIVLIGNGFDLAHGLKTSYKDFIYWYWDKCYERAKICHNNKLVDKLCQFIIPDEYYTWNDFAGTYSQRHRTTSGLEFFKYIKEDVEVIKITYTPFMETICHSIETKGWVDIENLYYERLCSFVKEKEYNQIESLNEEMNYLTSLLTEYLKEIEKRLKERLLNKSIREIIYTPFKYNEIAISAHEDWNKMLIERYTSIDKTPTFANKYYETLKYYPTRDIAYLMIDFNKFKRDDGTQFIAMGADSINPQYIPECLRFPERIMLLNFNYTNTANQYIGNSNDIFSINHIHGDLTNPDSIIFGYGDELDEQYKTILNLNDNNYLRNVKSIKYLETPNYRNMLNFIESDLFQVYILGHSCGNSDRTLLNTIFEHKNCVSIKPYYHKKDDGSDNYIEIVQNISRNFTDMKLMRDRVVNKTFCGSLPQNAP